MSALASFLPDLAGLSSPLAHLDQVLFLAIGLFAIGLVGVTCRRNVLIMLLSVEIMLNAANLAFVAFSRVHGNIDGQVVVFFAMVVAAAEVAVGLAIVIAVYRLRRKETNVDDVRRSGRSRLRPAARPSARGRRPSPRR